MIPTSEIFLHASCYWLQKEFCTQHLSSYLFSDFCELTHLLNRSELPKIWFLTSGTSVSPLSSLEAPRSSQSNKLCLYTEGENLKLGSTSLTFTHTTNFITFSGIIWEGTELTTVVRYASLGSKFHTEVSVTLSKTWHYCRFAFSVGALEKRNPKDSRRNT